MKTWFVFIIGDQKVGTWANNFAEAKENMIAEYGDIPMKFVGMQFGSIGPQPDTVIYRGMSAVDLMISSGMGSILCSLRR